MNAKLPSLDVVYDAKDVLRLPSWRRERAQQIVEGCETAKYDDAWILRLVRYLVQRAYVLANYKTGTAAMHRAVRKLAADHYDIHNCVCLHEDGVTMRWIMEGAIMDYNSGLEKLSHILGVSQNVIRAYEAIYFDVRDRLDVPIFVVGKLLGPFTSRGTGHVDADLLWKAWGHIRGAESLMRIVSIGKITDAECAELRELAKAELVRKAAMGIVGRRVNDFNTHDVVMELTAFDALEKGVKTPDGADAKTKELQGLVSCVKPAVLSAVGTVPLELACKAEPRAYERVKQLAAGKDPGP